MDTKNNNLNNQQSQKPWYRYPWVWFIIALPASAVVASLYTVYIANQNAPVVLVKQNKFQIEKESSEQ